jgi:hypothetical protein
MVDSSYLKNTAETDHLTRLVLEQLMAADPDAVSVTELASTVGKSQNRVGQYLTRIRERFRNGDVPLTITCQIEWQTGLVRARLTLVSACLCLCSCRSAALPRAARLRSDTW